MSLRAVAPGRWSFQGLPFLRVGIMACAPRRAMASWQPLVSCAVSANTGDDFVRTNLAAQAWQHGRIAGGIVRHLNSADFQGRGVYAQMHLAPLPTVVRAMLLRFPFTFAQHLDAGTVDKPVQPCRRCVGRNLHGKILLAAADGAEIGNLPI